MPSPIISIIAAMAHHRVIGIRNELPWDLPEDMAHFRKTTQQKPVVMGRKTFESIGKPLPGRKNIIITRDPQWSFPGCLTVHSLEEAIKAGEGFPEIMIIGGAQIYKEALSKAHKLYLTFIDMEVEGDAFFPPWNEKEWRECARQHFSPSSERPGFDIVEYEYCA